MQPTTTVLAPRFDSAGAHVGGLPIYASRSIRSWCSPEAWGKYRLAGDREGATNQMCHAPSLTRTPSGMFTYAPAVAREKYLNCEQFCTYGQRQIAFNQFSVDAPTVGPDPGLHQPAGPGPYSGAKIRPMGLQLPSIARTQSIIRRRNLLEVRSFPKELATLSTELAIEH
jgi:hypothetical protein